MRRAAEWVLSEHTDTLEAAWDVCTAEEQTGFADLVEKGEVEARDAKRLVQSLVALGLGQTVGKKIRPSCQLLKEFTANLQSGLVSVSLHFTKPDAYQRNIRVVVDCRLRQITVRDQDFVDFVTDAVQKVGKPNLFFKDIRNILDYALKMVWRLEAQDGQSPRYESDYAAGKSGPLNMNDSRNLLNHL